MWNPAFQQIATQRHWRLETMTKAACPLLDLPTINHAVDRDYSECEQWRGQITARLQRRAPAAHRAQHTSCARTGLRSEGKVELHSGPATSSYGEGDAEEFSDRRHGIRWVPGHHAPKGPQHAGRRWLPMRSVLTLTWKAPLRRRLTRSRSSTSGKRSRCFAMNGT